MGRRAIDSWRLLHGIVCVYKPPETTSNYVLSRLKLILSTELNKLETSPPRKCIVADRSGDEVSISIRPSYADHPLCVGPRYQTRHIHTEILNPLSELSSGVLLVCLNGGQYLYETLKKLSFTRCYHLSGILGQATNNYHTTGKVLARAKYNKLQKARFDNTLASYQSALHTRVFEEYGVPLNSQEGYNFAVRGLYRPHWKGPTIVYAIKPVEFNPPNFTIEVQCINETEEYLLNLIHNLGVSLKCYATCTGIRCLRQGCFHVEHSLAKNQWHLDEILENLKLTWEILEKNYPRKMKFSPLVGTVEDNKEVVKDERPKSGSL